MRSITKHLKFISYLSFAFLYQLLCFPVYSETTSSQPEKKIVLLNWSEYLDPEVITLFEEKTGIKVKEVYYETDELRNDLLVASGGKGYDLMVSNGLNISQYVKSKWLAPVSEKDVPNLKHVDPKWRKAFQDAEKYAVPFMWGTLGIAYRSDKISTPVTSWMDIYRPDESLRGRIIMIKDSRDLIGMALKALGYSASSPNNDELKAARELLLAQKPYVRSYTYLSLSEKSTLVTGETLMAMIYNGDALMLKKFEPAIEYVFPKEGGTLWCDYFLVFNTVNKEYAYQFLNFIHEPEIMVRLAKYAYYATTNLTAEKLLPEDFLADETIYPSKEKLETPETETLLPPRVIKKYNTIFNTVIQ